MSKGKLCCLDPEFVKKLKLEAVENNITLLELTKRLGKIKEPILKNYVSANEKKTYWIKI